MMVIGIIIGIIIGLAAGTAFGCWFESFCTKRDKKARQRTYIRAAHRATLEADE